SPSWDGLKVSTATQKLLTPFTLLLRWLPSLTPVTSLSMLLGMV
ncbi:hypothetical protein LTSEMIN_5761, partial [Salmonella enterica subsp. enterica serovar Minnesota str. A4-603]